jgi:hypothetical protein
MRDKQEIHADSTDIAAERAVITGMIQLMESHLLIRAKTILLNRSINNLEF